MFGFERVGNSWLHPSSSSHSLALIAVQPPFSTVPHITLDHLVPSMLPFPVFNIAHPRANSPKSVCPTPIFLTARIFGSGTSVGSLGIRSISSALSFQTLTHSFALTEKATPLFSGDSALFAQNTRVGGGVLAFLACSIGVYLGIPHPPTCPGRAGNPSSATDSLATGREPTITGREPLLHFPTCFSLRGLLMTYHLGLTTPTARFIQQSGGFGRRAIRSRSTALRSGSPNGRPFPEFLRPCICGSFRSKSFRFR